MAEQHYPDVDRTAAKSCHLKAEVEGSRPGLSKFSFTVIDSLFGECLRVRAAKKTESVEIYYVSRKVGEFSSANTN